MKRLKIYNRKHLEAFVDDEDYDRCVRFRWYVKAQVRRNKVGNISTRHYTVYTVVVKPDGKLTHLHLARLVLKAPASRRVRHRGLNYLDCQKKNLTMSGVPQGHIPFEEVEAALKAYPGAKQRYEKRKAWLNEEIVVPWDV
jgi:hypothetical protein